MVIITLRCQWNNQSKKTLSVWLSTTCIWLLKNFVDENKKIPQVVPNYNLGKDAVLFSGTVDLMINDKKYTIKLKMAKVLVTQIPVILPGDFSFLKVSRKQVCTPVYKGEQKWDFSKVKTIAGQGKLYVLLQNTGNTEIPSIYLYGVCSCAWTTPIKLIYCRRQQVCSYPVWFSAVNLNWQCFIKQQESRSSQNQKQRNRWGWPERHRKAQNNVPW